MAAVETKEHRKVRRYRPKIPAFVILKTQEIPFVCRLLDISKKGLSFSFLPCLEGIIQLKQLDIMLPHPVCNIRNIPFKFVSDSDISIESAHGFATKRCSIEFSDLNQTQNARLQCLIETLLALPWGFSFADRHMGLQRPLERICPVFFISATPAKLPDTKAQACIA